MSMFTVKDNGFRQYIKLYPLTAIFVSICSLFFIITLLTGGFSKENLITLGAYERNLINDGEYWRLITYSLLHSSLLHFTLNMFFILILTRPIERVLGSLKYFLFVLFTIVFSSFMVHILSKSSFGVGASGFGYGLFGMYFYLMLKFHKSFIKHDKMLIFTFVVLGFITSLIPGISFMGHAGGFIGGIFFAAFCFRNENQVKNFYANNEETNIQF